MSEFVATPSGLILPERVAEARYAPPKFTGIDLFAGCGGFSLGMKQAGCHVVAAAEWDEASAVTYMANLCRYGEFTLHFVEPGDRDRLERYLAKSMRSGDGEMLGSMPTAGSGWIKHEPRSILGTSHFFFGDICKLTGDRILRAVGMERGEVGVVFGGPPCQGFSTAGRQDPNDARNELVFEFARLVVEISPKSVCMENVPNILNMVTHDGLPVVEVFGRILEDGGFTGVDAIRKSLKQRTGSIGLLRGGGRRGKRAEPQTDRDQDADRAAPPEPGQPDLFALAETTA